MKTVKNVAPTVSKAKKRSKEELAKLDLFWRKTMSGLLKMRHPSIAKDEIKKILDELVPLIIKSLYKSDKRAATKILNMANGEDKVSRLAVFLIIAIKSVVLP